MKFVRMGEDIEYVSLELRLETPDDPDMHVILKSQREPKGPVGLLEEAEELIGNGFKASVWRVSRQSICERLKHDPDSHSLSARKRKGIR